MKVDEKYRKAFKEVNDILENTEEDLRSKIPESFMEFLKSNMDKDYITNIRTDISIANQSLLEETEGILYLIYKNYWATEKEKEHLNQKFKEELHKIEKDRYKGYNDLDEALNKQKK